MKIAVSGKGGAGKTTLAANLIYCFSREGYKVFAVDADPDANLGLNLGLDPHELEKVKPLIEMKEVIEAKTGGGGAFYDLSPQVDDVLEQYSLKKGNISFLVMGAVKQGGTACYCRENSFLHAVINSLLLDKDEVVLLDMSAGIEHLTRGTAGGVDLLLVVTEPNRAGIKTANNVIKLAQDLGIKGVKIIGNKIRKVEEEQIIRAAFPQDSLLGFIPFTERIWERAVSAEIPLFEDKDLLPGMNGIYERILEEVKN